jgi:ABC-type branched-subunit amino acid transport system substrate-binding protein
MITNFSYGLDTLTLILRIMHENPEQVYYIRGVSEESGEWADGNIGEESMIRLKRMDWDVFNDLMIRFVDTLPSALYLVAEYTGNSMNLVCISGRDLNSKYFEERRLSVYFTNPGTPTINIDEQDGSIDKKIKISSVVSTEYFSLDEYARTEGLRRDVQERGSGVWKLVSGSTNARRVFNGFFYDAFVVLTTANTIKDWTITLYNQDVRFMTGIYPKSMYNLITGKELINKTIRQRQLELLRMQKNDLDYALQNALKESKLFAMAEVSHSKVDADVAQKKEIVFGSLMDLSRNLKGISYQLIAGINLLFNTVNEKGGINGSLLSLVVLDDEYIPAKSRVQVRLLMDKHKINTLLMPMGSPTLESYLDLVKEQKVCVLFPHTGLSLFRDPQLKYLVHFRASYAQEGQVLGRYALEVFKAKKVVLFYQEDVESIDGILNYFASVNFSNYSKITYSTRDVSFEKQIREINKIHPDTFIFLSSPTATYELMRQIGTENFAKKNLLGWSILISQMFQNFVRVRGLRIVLSSVVPNPLESELPIVKEYRQYADVKGVIKDGESLEGFINASIVVQALKEIKGPFTRQKLIEKIESFRNYDLGGITLNFDHLSRQLSSSVWLNTGKKEWERFEVQPIVSSVVNQRAKNANKDNAL